MNEELAYSIHLGSDKNKTTKAKETASIVLYANIPVSQPVMVVGETAYPGEFFGDSNHIRFVMPDMRRSKSITADIFDGEKRIASGLKFRIQKKTSTEQQFF